VFSSLEFGEMVRIYPKTIYKLAHQIEGSNQYLPHFEIFYPTKQYFSLVYYLQYLIPYERKVFLLGLRSRGLRTALSRILKSQLEEFNH